MTRTYRRQGSHASHTASRSHKAARSTWTSRAPQASGGMYIFTADPASRIKVVIGVAVAIVAVFLLAFIKIQIIDGPQYVAAAESMRVSTYPIEPRRGTIYDRNGNVLAISVDKTTIVCDPSEIVDTKINTKEGYTPWVPAQILAEHLGGNAEDYYELITQPDSKYALIYRKAEPNVADKIEDALEEAGVLGIYFTSDPKREYPHGEIGGQIIGAVQEVADAETNRQYYVGISGLEAYYDDVLSGEPGWATHEQGKDGTKIPNGIHEEQAPVDGQDIVISIDLELQRKVEETLKKGVKDLKSKGATSVVIDGATGEIYAAASLPLFNPADRSVVEEGATTLKVVTDLFEPGSIFKTVAAMAILENEVLTPDDEIFCPAELAADEYFISDAHERGDATFTFREILDQSSNVGISLSTELLGFDKFYDAIIRYNLHSDTGVDFPGEGEVGTDILGMMKSFDTWSKMDGYSASFGQGVSITALQIARFYGAIVNNGVECTPHFLISYPQTGEVVEYETEQVIENTNAIPVMQDMLKTVVTEGTGTGAAIEGFNVAGKTSTAEIYDEKTGTYKENSFNLAFTGFIADSNSSLVCFVGAQEVPGDGTTTALFKDIMTTAIDRFRISPVEPVE